MKREYLVYVIRNVMNGKVYVGSTVNMSKRKARHLNDLNKNSHANKHLQKAWNKYGEENFIHEIIEVCANEEVLRKKELEHIARLNALNHNLGYNISESTTNFSASGVNHPHFGKCFKTLGYKNHWKGKRLPESTKEKLRRPRSEKSKIRMSLNHADFSGSNNPMYGREHSKKTLEKISKSLKGKAVGENHPMYGKKRSGELAGHKKKVAQYGKDGVFVKEYINITEAAKETGSTRQHISKCCKGERKTTGGFRWEYVN